jgi:hypothetical protein
MTEQRKERGWPMLVISTGGVIHISRANAPHGKVKCDCGRTIEHRGNIANTNLDELEASDGKTVTFYDRWTYKFCQRCGSKEDFIEAQKKSIKALAENKERREAKWDAEQKELAKTQAAVRSCMAAEVLYGITGVDDVVHDGWSISFTLRGNRYKLTAEVDNA